MAIFRYLANLKIWGLFLKFCQHCDVFFWNFDISEDSRVKSKFFELMDLKVKFGTLGIFFYLFENSLCIFYMFMNMMICPAIFLIP